MRAALRGHARDGVAEHCSGPLTLEPPRLCLADDTQALLKDYAQIDKLWIILQIYEEATGMRANPNKFEGIRLGPLKHQPPPTLNGRSRLIKWLERGSYTKILGIPYYLEETQEESNKFWEELYTKIKVSMANLRGLKDMKITGRALVANFKG